MGSDEKFTQPRKCVIMSQKMANIAGRDGETDKIGQGSGWETRRSGWRNLVIEDAQNDDFGMTAKELGNGLKGHIW